MTGTVQGFSDLPTTQDELGFEPSIDALYSVLDDLALEDTPLTIGVYGPWGSGKTSLMRMLHKRLEPDNALAQNVPIWFDAWRYVQTDALWRALLLSVVEGLRTMILSHDERLRSMLEVKDRMRDQGHNQSIDNETLEKNRKQLSQQLDDLVVSLYKNVEREENGELTIDWRKAGAATAQAVIRVGFSLLPGIGPALGIATKAIEKAQEKIGEAEDINSLVNAFQRERSKVHRDQVRSLEQFYVQLNSLVREWIIDTQRRLVIFVDDLDRCLPEQAVSVLEAIKVFLDMRGCVFVLGFDREVIQRGIRIHYKDFALSETAERIDRSTNFPIAGRDYLDKIVQIPFEIPPVEMRVISEFLGSRLRRQDWVDETEANEIVAIMTTGLMPNPRKLKRTVNTFRLMLALAKAHRQSIVAGLLAKLTIIQNSYSEIYTRLVDDPRLIIELEKIANGREFVVVGKSDIDLEVQDSKHIEPGLSIPKRLKILQAEVYPGLYSIASNFGEISVILEQAETHIAELNLRYRQELQPNPDNIQPELDFKARVEKMAARVSRKINEYIPQRLIGMLRLRPYFGDIDEAELRYHIFLTRFTEVGKNEPELTKPATS